MKSLYIEDLKDKIGQDVVIYGWVHRKRRHGNLIFIVIRDGTGIVQTSVKRDKVDDSSFASAFDVTYESSVCVAGKVAQDARAPGGIEVVVEEFNTLNLSPEFPIKKDTGTEVLMDMRHLHLRSRRLTNIMKTRKYAVDYLREFFDERGFWEVSPPIFTQAGVEGGSTLFNIKYFDTQVYLSQSAQLYNEAFITSLEKIFVLAPSFRAEKSRTPRHLIEYWHLEEEAAFYDNEDNMKFQEDMVSNVCEKLTMNHGELLEFFGRRPGELRSVQPPFPRMRYEKAVELLQSLGSGIQHGDDLGVEDERLLTEDLSLPIFVTHYPYRAKPFYMRRDPEDPGYVLNADLLAPEGHGEIVGGSERIWKFDELVERIHEDNLPEEAYSWYIDLRRYGSVPHSGFGMGIERLLKWILKLEHIRDAVPFPRTPSRVSP